jgi:hypothetical protein
MVEAPYDYNADETATLQDRSGAAFTIGDIDIGVVQYSILKKENPSFRISVDRARGFDMLGRARGHAGGDMLTVRR